MGGPAVGRGGDVVAGLRPDVVARGNEVGALKKLTDWFNEARRHHLRYVVLDLLAVERSAVVTMRLLYEDRCFGPVAVPTSS